MKLVVFLIPVLVFSISLFLNVISDRSWNIFSQLTHIQSGDNMSTDSENNASLKDYLHMICSKNVTSKTRNIVCNQTLFVVENFHPDTTNGGSSLTLYHYSFNATINIFPSSGPHAHGKNTFKRAEIPYHYRMITNHSAYFASLTCEGNLHHFWIDTVIGLLGAMNAPSNLFSQTVF